MKNIKKIEYKRISYDETKEKLEKMIEELKTIKDFEKFLKIVREIIELQNEIEEMYDYADIQNMRTLDDEFYKEEVEYWNATKPKFDVLFVPFYQVMLDTEFKDKLNDVIPENFFNTVSSKIKITSDKVVDLKRRENELKSEYRSLNKISIDFEKERLTLPRIAKYFTSNEREVRKKAHDAVNEYYYSQQDKYISILYELVKVRNEISRELGFNDYSEYSLHSLRRFGYDYDDIRVFRDNVIKYFIPLCNSLNEFKRKELGVDRLTYYDTVFFSDSPKLLYSNEELLEKMENVFFSIDGDLGKLFKDMLDNGYIDFCTRENKVNFSITNYLVCEAVPVVTGNYKGNYNDVLTTTHEMGHSYQKYLAGIEDKKYIVSPLLKYPTFEIAEMFSYALQLIAIDYVDSLFSDDDKKKYGFLCIYNLITMMPYICLIDEFQETIYKKVDLKPEDISLIYIELSKKYHLYDGYSGNKNLESGNYYFRQTHVYSDPFYYIDYALSYFGAFAIWSKSSKNLDVFKNVAAVASYYPFKKLIALYGMPNPFEEKSFEEVSIMLKKVLEKNM